MKNIVTFLLCLSVLACQQNGADKENTASNDIADKVAIAREAFVYGLPLVLMDLSRRQMINGTEGSPAVAPNDFRHRTSFPDASFRDVVRPNADTYYSIGWLTLAEEPVVLEAPDTKGRYYMMPMIDAYTNVFASPGSRTTGTGKSRFLITGPSWKGTVPDEMKAIVAPTNMVWIIGRTQVNSKQDGLKTVAPLQQAFRLIPLSKYGMPFKATLLPYDSTVPKGSPNELVKQMPVNDFFNYVNKLMIENPPPAADSLILGKMASIGVKPGGIFDLSAFSEDDKKRLKAIPEETLTQLQSPDAKPGRKINGWSFTAPNVGKFETDYLERARIAYIGLGANLAADAVYPSCYTDSSGQQLNGKNKYVLHFDAGQTPPANAFWSITMYDMEGFMIPNPLNRNAIGDRSGLKKNTDGSIDIFIQHTSPGKNNESNWLPAPPEDFNLLLRIYWPKDEVLGGSWQVPSVKKQN